MEFISSSLPSSIPFHTSATRNHNISTFSTDDMARRHVSPDLKARIPVLKHAHGYTVQEIVSILGVQKTLVYETLKSFSLHGVASRPAVRSGGRTRFLHHDDINFVKSVLEQDPTLYLDELQDQLLARRGVSVSIPTLLRAIRRIHFSRKSLSIRALERNDLNRSIYMNTFASLVSDPWMVMFVDEAARNKKSSARRKGWSLKGRRCVQRQCFVRGQRFSILPVLTLDGIIAYDIIPGSVTAQIFLEFIRVNIIPLTNPYPGPRSVLVLDNCNIHHSEALRQLVEDEAGKPVVGTALVLSL
ncbi:hypothetical protein D9619_012502 [Psilocybe cf. subviscida]|uniref:Tc1-like transposase DDE domain-containing protein n=1 Tax=Psilocybe cf. subviscida TaxID=2480587 RepID=A0A8H5B6Y9_9AGAR|nr:hypothetical protein D9619_012502 [Psilocybe cf. subviscida]